MARANRSRPLYAHEMTDCEHAELADVLHDIRGMAVVSGYESPLYSNLYKGWTVFGRQYRKDRGGVSTECLYVSPNAVFNELLFAE